jgi:hypothetical protein
MAKIAELADDATYMNNPFQPIAQRVPGLSLRLEGKSGISVN